VNIQIAADLPATRPHWVKVGDKIQMRGFLRRGRGRCLKRAEKFLLCLEKGRYSEFDENNRDAERDPAWSPDGKWMHFSPTNRANMRCIWRINPASAKSRKSI